MREEAVKNALAFARQGFQVFPAFWKKDKKQHVGLAKWSTEASSDANKIRAWGSLHPDHAYFCVALKQSERTVVDVDVKGEKNGLLTLDDLTLLNEPLPETLTVRTPNNGYHYYFLGAARSGANRLGQGVDIPVMVPLPGSVIPDKGIYQLVNNAGIKPLPAWIKQLAGESYDNQPKDDDALIELDQPYNIDRAIDFLKNEAEPAIEGEGGNDHTFRVLCRVRDLGVSDSLCGELAVKYYNPRCRPPWSDSELAKLVENVYNYASSIPGEDDPQVEFDPIIPPNLIQFSSYYDLTSEIVSPDWLVKNYFETETITVLYGDSGSYKSFLAISIGLHIASHKEWIGQRTKGGAVFYLAGEGHGGIRRRLSAWRHHYTVAEQHKAANRRIPFHVSPHAIQIGKKKNTKRLIESIKAADPNPALIIIDTLATAFGGGDENSAKDMTRFLNHVQAIRKALGCTIFIIHHTGHREKERPRGSYALMAGVDAYYQVEKTEPYLTCLRSAGKMKDAMPPADTWFQMEPVTLGVDEDLDDISSLVPIHQPGYCEPVRSSSRLGGNQMAILRLLSETNAISIEMLRDNYKKDREAAGEAYNPQNFKRTLESLINRKYVRIDGTIVRPIGQCLVEGE